MITGNPDTSKSKVIVVLCLIIGMMNTNGHSQTMTPVGEYSLRGVMETASGIRINADSTFDFFYSYGAMDREGSGKWKVVGNKIILNSKPKPGEDYKLISSSSTRSKEIVVKITDKNTTLYRYMHAALMKNDSLVEEKSMDKEGIAKFELVPFNKIGLYFELFPEKSTFIVPEKSSLNSFEFGFQPWIAEVFFDKMEFSFDKNGLKGKHPLLDPNKEFYFEKEK